MDIINLINQYNKNHIISASILILSTILIIVGIKQIRDSQVSILQNEITNKQFIIDKQINNSENMITIDISGAVINPGSYTLSKQSRLKDAVVASGGLSKSADKDFFSRNYNLAKILIDEEKIYVPSYTEINIGKFQELDRIVNIELEIKNNKK